MDVVIAACAVGDGDPYFDAGDAAAIVQLIFFEFGWDCLCPSIRGVGTEFLDRSFLSVSDIWISNLVFRLPSNLLFLFAFCRFDVFHPALRLSSLP